MKDKFYKILVANSPFGFAYHQILLNDAGAPVDYEFLEVNKAFENATGLKGEEITGKKVSEILPGIRSDRFDWVSFYGKVAIEGIDEIFEQYSEQLMRWFKVHVYSPEKYFFATVFTDITAEKEQAERLAQTEKRYRGLIESQNDLIVRVDNQNRFTFVNEAYSRTFGKSPAELTGKSFFPLVHEDDREATAKAMEQLKTPPYRCYVEQRAMTVNGWRWLAWENNAILNEKNEIIEVQGVGRDITQQKEREDIIRKHADSLEKLLSAAPAVIYSFRLIDGQPDLYYLSENVKRVLGYEPEIFYHNFTFWQKCVHPDDMVKLAEQMKQGDFFKNPGIEDSSEYRFMDSSGNYKWIADRHKTILNSAGETEVIGVWIDITPEKQKMEELNQYKQRLTLAQTFARTGSWEYDIISRKLFWSKECEALFGIDEGSFEGTFEDFLKRVHPDDREYVLSVNKPITELNEGKPLSYEHRIIHANGNAIWVKETAGVVNDHTGTPVKIIGLVADITQQKIAEEAIENEEKLRQIVNNIAGVFWLRSADRHDMLYVSPSIERLCGITQNELYENPDLFTESVHPDDKEQVQKALKKFLETGIFNEDYRIVSPDGELRWMASGAFPVKNEKGETIRFAGIVNDITGQKQNELAVKEHAKKIDALIGALPDIYFMLDKQGIYHDVITADPSVLLAPPEKVIGSSIFDFFEEEEAKRQLDLYEICLNEQRLVTFEYELMIGNEPMYFEARLNPVNDQMLLAILRNITTQKQLAAKHEDELNYRKFLFSNDKNGLVILNNDHKVTDVNPRFCEMTGYSADELLTMYTWDFDNQITKKEIKEGFDVKVDVDVTFESCHRRKDGSTYDVEVSAKSFYWKGERFVHCSCRDITERITAAKQLKESEEKYRMLFNANKDSISIFYLSEKGEPSAFIEMNEAGAGITGYTREELLQMKISDIEEPPSPDEMAERVKILKEKGEASFEIKLRKKNGELIDAEVKAKLITYNQRPALLNITRDITERKKAENELRTIAERLRLANKATRDVIWEWDVIKNTQQWSEAGTEIFGWTEIVERPVNAHWWVERVHPYDRQRVHDSFFAVVNNPELNFWTDEYLFLKTDDSYANVMDRGYVLRDADGKAVRMIGAMQDITQRKKTEKELEEYEIRANQLMKQTQTTFFEIDPEGKYIYLSPSVYELSGYTVDELKDKMHYFDLVPEDQRGEMQKQVVEIMRQKQSFNRYISSIVTKDGAKKWIITSASPVVNEKGDLISYRGSSTDITELRNAQEAIRQSEEKYRVVADNTISWEFWESPEGEFLYNSPSCEKITGYKSNELVKNQNLFLGMIHPDDREAYKDHQKDVSLERRVRNHHFRIIKPDGEIRHIEHQCLPVFSSDGMYLGIRGSNTDITKRMLAEEAILTGKKRIESFLETSRSMTETMDPEKIMQIIVDNATRVMGLGSGAIYLKNSEDSIRLAATTPALPHEIPDILRVALLKDHPHIARSLATGHYVLMPDALNAELTSAEQEVVEIRRLRTNLYLPVRLREKSIGVLILSSVENIFEFSSEEINLLQGFANQAAGIIDNANHFEELKKYAAELEREIAQRKEIEKALNVSHERLRKVVEVETVGVMFWDLTTGRMTDANTSLLKMLGFSRNELDAGELTWQKLTPPEYIDISMEEIEKFYKTGRIGPYEKEYYRKDGSRTWFLFAGSALGENAAVEFCVDISDRKKIENELRDREERLKLLSNNIPDGMVYQIYSDKDGSKKGFTYISDGVQHLHGITAEAAMQNPMLIYSQIAEEDRSRFMLLEAESVANMTAFRAEYRIVHPSGETRWLLTASSPRKLDNGDLIWDGIEIDITVQKLKDRKLQTQQILIAEMGKLAKIGGWELDTTSGIASWTEETARIHGLNSDDNMNIDKAMSFYKPHSRVEIESAIEKAIADGTPYDLEIEIITAQGEEKWVQTIGQPVIENGKVVRLRGSFQDITERKLALEALRKSEEFNRRLLATIPDLVIRTDLDGKIVFVNDPGNKNSMLITKEELIGRNMLSFILETDLERAVENTRLMFEKPLGVQEYKLKLDDERIFDFEVNGDVVRNAADNPVGMVYVVRNITERKLAEKALRDSEYFANAVANNTPALLYLWDVESNRNIWSNNLHKEYFEAFSETGGNLSGEEVQGIVHPDDYAALYAKTLEMINNREISACQLEIRHKTNDGWKWMNSISSVFKTDERGKATQILGALFDIDDRKRAEEVVKQSEERFRQVTETNQTVIWELDANGIYTYVSPVAEKIWGYKPEELVGIVSYFDLHPKEGRQDFFEETMMLLKESGSFRDFPNQVQKPDGSIIWVSSNGRPVFDEQGNITGYRGSDQDITDRLLAEKELRKFKTISDQANYGTAITDLEGKNLYVNDYFAKMHGWDANELLGKHLTVFHNEEQLALVNDLLIELKTKGNFSAKEVDHIRKDGSVFTALMNASIIFNDKGEPLFLTTTAIDITEIKAARLELLKLTQAVVQNPVGITITNINGVIEYVNPQLCRMTEYQEAELVGQNCRIFNSGHHSKELYTNLWTTILNGETWSGELLNRKKNGQLYWENVSISPIRDSEGKILNFVGIKEDITHQKQLMEDLIIAKEKAEESNRLKTAFMNNISHEVRTPLNGILGFGGIIIDEDLDREEKQNYYQFIKKSSDRLQQTITDIMDISELKAGTLKPNISEVNVIQPLTTLFEKTTATCSQRNILVSLNVAEEHRKTVLLTDGELLSKILIQLLNNAEKFTQQGRIIIGMEILKREAMFFVKDTGQGIAADKLNMIFEPFMQEDNSTTRGHEGSGLGLAIARGMVELLGGRIWVESEKNIGSTFYFTLPLPDNLTGTKTAGPAINQQKSEKPLILIAEDDQSNYLYFKTILHKNGYSTLHVFNGAEAVDFCQKYPEITLVLMDIKMPVMNGIEATKKIREFRPDLPIIATTAYAQTGEKHRILSEGCNDYLAKPISPSDILAMIRKYS